MKRLLPAAVLVGLLAPAVCLAADAGPVVLSLKDGVPAELLRKTLGVAQGLFVLALVFALLNEAFGGSPTQQKNYGGVVWRALLVVALLSGYRVLFGSVISTAQGIADRIAPASIYTAFGQHNIQAIESLKQQAQAQAPADGGGLLSSLTAKVVTGYVGGALFDGLVLVFVALGQALHWGFIQFSQVLVSVLYVLGPIALVFHIPASSDVARRWFRAFVTVACWPIFTAVLLAMATALLMRTDSAAVFGQYSTAFGALGSTVLIVLMCLAAPLMASAIIGGSLKNVPLESLVAAGLGAAAMARSFGKNARAVGEAAKETSPSGATSPVGSTSSPDVTVPTGGPSSPPAPAGDSVAIPAGGAPSASASPAPTRSGRAPSALPASDPVGFAVVPSAVAVPAAGEAPAVYEVLEKTAVRGPGRPKGEGSFAGAWKLPKPKGLASSDFTIPGEHTKDVSTFAEPITSVPPKFNSADWDDIGQ